ncbi:rhodopsin-like [Etheostoma cragini]|uniref:rhodopsin-like n=1 Tax=Etheostoma cragini TaxID=417921 RepID=UPI00155E6915|nr:rhodopsin-like [Etheostoma cragini]
MGWASYKDRGYGTCEIDWARASYAPSYRAYIISIFSSCFFLPVLVMLFCYVSIINTVKRGNALAGGELSDRQRRVERDVTIVSIVICTAFILAWSPYAVVSIWSAWGYQVPNLTSIFTRLFAKSASFYNPLIYFGLNSKFRKDVVVLLPCTPDAKDAVRLKRFRPQADARLRVQLNRPEKKYSPGNNPYPAPSPPTTPPPANKEVFYNPTPHPLESNAAKKEVFYNPTPHPLQSNAREVFYKTILHPLESNAANKEVFYKTTPHPLESNAANKEVFYKTTPHPLESNAANREVFYINMPPPLESNADFECDRL